MTQYIIERIFAAVSSGEIAPSCPISILRKPILSFVQVTFRHGLLSGVPLNKTAVSRFPYEMCSNRLQILGLKDWLLSFLGFKPALRPDPPKHVLCYLILIGDNRGLIEHTDISADSPSRHVTALRSAPSSRPLI